MPVLYSTVDVRERCAALPSLMRAVRVSRGLSYRRCAEATGMTDAMWRMVEKGERRLADVDLVLNVIDWLDNPGSALQGLRAGPQVPREPRR